MSLKISSHGLLRNVGAIAIATQGFIDLPQQEQQDTFRGAAYKIDREWLDEDEESLLLFLVASAMLVDEPRSSNERNRQPTDRISAGTRGQQHKQ